MPLLNAHRLANSCVRRAGQHARLASRHCSLIFEVVYDTLEEVAFSNGSSDTVAARKAPGLCAQMTKFDLFFGLQISLRLFSSAEEVARVLQSKDLTSEAVSVCLNAKNPSQQLPQLRGICAAVSADTESCARHSAAPGCSYKTESTCAV